MMETIIGVVVTFIVLGIIGAITEKKEGGSSGSEAGEFKIRVKEVIEKNEETGYVYPAFAVQARGHIPIPHDQCPVEFRLHLFDGSGVACVCRPSDVRRGYRVPPQLRGGGEGFFDGGPIRQELILPLQKRVSTDSAELSEGVFDGGPIR